MEPSQKNDYNLADILNTAKHVLFVSLAGAINALLQGVQSGQVIDWASFKQALVIAVLTGLLVFVNRYLKDNTGGNSGSEGQT